jgi:hypothetical protein
MFKKSYDIIYSIGDTCSCATCIKSFNLRLTSGPFDWIVGASIETRLNLILNGFTDFLNLDDLQLIIERKGAVFGEYKNLRNNFYFGHDFINNTPLERSYNEVKEKYDRRIKRFYDNISKKALLLYIDDSGHSLDDPFFVDDNKLQSLCGRISEKFNKNIDFIFISHSQNIKRGEINEFQVSENIVKCQMFCHKDAPGMFSNKEFKKLFKNIFKNIRLQNRKEIIKRRIRHLLLLFISNLAVNRKLKDKIRSFDKEYRKF